MVKAVEIAASVALMLLATAGGAQDLKSLVYKSPPGGIKGLQGEVTLYDNSYAVVIGISDYDTLPDLPGAERDASAVSVVLQSMGFNVTEVMGKGATRRRIAQILGDRMPLKAISNDRVLVYFAGHGLTLGDEPTAMGYLMPVEGRNDQRASTGISMRELQAWFSAYKAKHVMFLADACYSGLALSTRSAGLPTTLADYLLRVTEQPVRVALTAGRANQEAYEWRGHGLFTYFLLEALRGRGGDANADGILTSSELYSYLEPNVAQTALANWRAEQNPQLGRSGQGEFIFLTAKASETGETASGAEDRPWQPSEQVEIAFWNSINNSDNPSVFKAYLEKYPDGQFAALARIRLDELLASGSPAPTDKPPPVDFTLPLGNGIVIEFVEIKPGRFKMGSENGDGDEQPVRTVNITRGFQLGKHEVTQEQWEAVTGSNPSYFKGAQRPVEQVSWNDVQEFLTKLNARSDGWRYRLPTEAEWEYAARAGTEGDYAGNLEEMAWCSENSNTQTHPVGQKKPNAWGLYDMHGNVVEWVRDWYKADYYASRPNPDWDPQGPDRGSHRVIRGGGFDGGCRSATRFSRVPGGRGIGMGFRLLRQSE